MENSTVAGLRSRSRSKTPFLRSSCDREGCLENEEHTHKSGRKTPVKRSTPVKQLRRLSATRKSTTEPIVEEDESTSPPAHRTRQAAKSALEKVIKTSDYSSEESPDRLRAGVISNHEYERVTTSSATHRMTGSTHSFLSPVHGEHVSEDNRSARFGSPTYSGCSSDSSFAEATLADASVLLESHREHLPSRLYRMVGEYWNKYPKTDFTYSPMSRDRVELAPGQVAVPNMSRRSLANFRVQGPTTSVDEVDQVVKSWSSTQLRKRYQNVESSDDETAYVHNGRYTPISEHWWITRLLISIVSSITTTTSSLYNKAIGRERYPYTARGRRENGLLFRVGSTLAAPFVWIYTLISKTVTTTVETVTENTSPSKTQQARRAYYSDANSYRSQEITTKRRRWWPLLLLPLLFVVGCGSYYTYENYEHLALPNFTDFRLDLPEFSALELSKLQLPSFPNISLPDMNFTLPNMNFSLPDINITLPNIRGNLPEVSKTYNAYMVVLQDKVTHASDYMQMVAESCYKEMRKLWRGVIGYWSEDLKQVLPQLAKEHQEYKPLDTVNDPNLVKRIAALEEWASSVDSKMKGFDIKLSQFDNLESKIETISLRHLQQNLIQIFNINSESGDAVSLKLKEYFDKHYVSKDQLQDMEGKLHEKLASVNTEVDEDKIRMLVEEYLSIFERNQKEVMLERVREYIKEIQVQRIETGFDVEAVKKVVTDMLKVYDADKTGIVDYALESAGGQIISTKCTELYQIKTKQYFILGFPVWSMTTTPRNALTPGTMPSECWAFQGFPGYLVIRLFAIIEVTGFSVEHMSRLLAVDGKIESAPKNFSVYGLIDELDQEPHLFGDYTYDSNGTAIQYFPVKYPKTEKIGAIDYPMAYDIIELRIESNHGNPTYTCVYRFRVHGNPLSDIRRATEDSLKGIS